MLCACIDFEGERSCLQRSFVVRDRTQLSKSLDWSQIQTAIYGIDRRPNIDVSTTFGIAGAAPSPRRELLRKFVLGQDVNVPKWIRCKRKIT